MLCSPFGALVDELPARWSHPVSWVEVAGRKIKDKRRHLNRRVVLCVIVGNGGRAVATAIFGSEDATFR